MSDALRLELSWKHYRQLLCVLKKVFAASELAKDSVIQNFRITAADGKSHNSKQYFGSVVNRRPEIMLSVMPSLCHRQASNPL